MTREYLVYQIIDNMEGGYYHPDMKSKLRGGERMLESGETMFGIDREAGKPLFVTGTPAAIRFWQVVDENFGNHHADVSYYGDKADGTMKTPAAVGAQLRPLAAAMIIDAFEKNAQFLSAGAREMVFNNPKLLLQFLYATYNGPGNFQTFANVMNAAYGNGERSVEAFWNLIQAARRKKGGLFAEGADKLDAIATTLPDGSGTGWLWWLLGGIAVSVLIYKMKK